MRVIDRKIFSEILFSKVAFSYKKIDGKIFLTGFYRKVLFKSNKFDL